MSQGKTKKKDDKSWIFIFLLLIGVVFILFSQTSKPAKSKHNVNSNDQETNQRLKRVDNHLKDTAYNVEVDRRQRQIEVYQELNKLQETSAQNPYRESKNFSLESDPYMQSLTQDLDRSRQTQADQLTPEEIVQQRLYENDQLKKASESYREAYAAQFIENARKGGWEIELGPNFEVLSAKKIRPRSPSLFEEGSSGGSR